MRRPLLAYRTPHAARRTPHVDRLLRAARCRQNACRTLWLLSTSR